MTRDDIISMAREANIIDFRDENDDEHVKQMVDMLEHVVALAAAAEREACVQICVEQACRHPYPSHAGAALTVCADAIRARGQA